MRRRGDTLPHGEDGGDGRTFVLTGRRAGHDILRAQNLVLRAPEKGRRVLPGAVEDHARLPARRGGGPGGFGEGGIQGGEGGDDGNVVLFLEAS